jgi:hypothetical protein
MAEVDPLKSAGFHALDGGLDPGSDVTNHVVAHSRRHASPSWRHDSILATEAGTVSGIHESHEPRGIPISAGSWKYPVA